MTIVLLPMTGLFALAGVYWGQIPTKPLVPDPSQLLEATMPSGPENGIEAARFSRIETEPFTNPFIIKSVNNPRALKATAAVCMISWRVREPGFKAPAMIKATWDVFEQSWAAKISAQTRTWIVGGKGPNKSIPSGSFSGRRIGTQSWHVSKTNLAKIVVLKDKILIEVLIQPALGKPGKPILFDRIRRKDTALIESMASALLAKTSAFVSAHS